MPTTTGATMVIGAAVAVGIATATGTVAAIEGMEATAATAATAATEATAAITMVAGIFISTAADPATTIRLPQSITTHLHKPTIHLRSRTMRSPTIPLRRTTTAPNSGCSSVFHFAELIDSDHVHLIGL